MAEKPSTLNVGLCSSQRLQLYETLTQNVTDCCLCHSCHYSESPSKIKGDFIKQSSVASDSPAAFKYIKFANAWVHLQLSYIFWHFKHVWNTDTISEMSSSQISTDPSINMSLVNHHRQSARPKQSPKTPNCATPHYYSPLLIPLLKSRYYLKQKE